MIVRLLPLFALLACAPAPELALGTDGKPLPRLYNLAGSDAATIQFRLLDAVNALRGAAAAPALGYDAALNAAAATHARDMSVQNRAWHFGSDGSSPLDRTGRAGYRGQFLGEAISETYETELETLAAWMEQPDTRAVILDPRARELGFAWHQDADGKIWWALLTGAPAGGVDDGSAVTGSAVSFTRP